MPACKATNTDDSACLKDRLRRSISFVRSEEGRRTPPGPSSHDRRARREPTQERRRRSVTRGGGEAASLQTIPAVTPRTRTGAAAPCSRGDGTEDWWIAAITAANSASLSRGGHLGFLRGTLKRTAPTRLTCAASAVVGPPAVNSPGFSRGVSGFSMIRIRWSFLSVTRRLNLARRARMSPEGTPVTRILIADDHEVVRFGLRAILEAHEGGEVVAEACAGKEAIAKAVETSPDVAIIDYSLPMMNGVEATRQIRARVPTAEVLIFTMHDSEVLVGELLEAGARAYLL